MNIAYGLAHFFYPQRSNNHKAKVLHPSGLGVIIALLIVYQVAISAFPTIQPGILGYAANIPPSQVIELANQKRAENGLLPLTHNSTLSAAAQSKGVHMLEQNYWAHIAPDGTEPWKFFTDFNYNYRFAGENLARDFSNPNSAIDAWMASPTHRDNMLSEKYTEVGVAVVEGDLDGVDTTIIVQFFGVPFADVAPATVALSEVPEPALVVQPTAEPSAVPVAAVVQGGQTEPEQVLVSPFSISRNVTLGVVGVLLGVVAIDLIVISRKKLARISGRSFAHLAFLGMILAIILIAKAGQIL